MRPIDADALIENLQGSKVTTDSKDMDYKTMWQLLCTLVVEAIENEPTVLPSADAVHGEWLRSEIPNEKWVCSNCGGACWYYDYQGSLGKSNYCPSCGARMYKGGENE